MTDVPNITHAEWEVMEVLWRRSPRTANEVVEALDGRSTWKPKTVQTLVGRLMRKGALGFEKKGREFHYYPLIGRDECVRAETRSFLRRVGGAGLRPVVAAFLEEDSLSPEEIADLRRLIEKRDMKQLGGEP